MFYDDISANKSTEICTKVSAKPNTGPKLRLNALGLDSGWRHLSPINVSVKKKLANRLQKQTEGLL